MDVRYSNYENNYYGIYSRYNDDNSIRNIIFDNNTCGIVAFYSDFTIQNNTFSNGYYGMLSYYSDNVIKGNTISNNSYGVYIINANPSITGNEISGNSNSGIYAASSSGPELTSVRYYGVNDVNNYIHNNNNGVHSSSNSFPNLGIYTDSAPLIWGGFNLFKDNSSYGVKNSNSGYTLMAEVNWWRNEPGNYGSVDISPNADQALGMGPGSLPKTTGTDTLTTLDNLLISAQLLEMDSSFTEALVKYDSIITLGYQEKIAQTALIGIERCFAKMDSIEGLINYLDNIHNSYPNEFIGTAALYFSAGAYAKMGDLETALARFQEVTDIYQNTPGAQEETAWALFDLGQVYEMLAQSESGLGKLTAEGELKAKDCYRVIMRNYPQTESAKFLHEFLGEEYPDEVDVIIPEVYALKPNYPNPFNPITNINYALPEDSFVELMIYNLLGQEVRKLPTGNEPAGIRSIVWDGRDNRGRMASSGVYIYRLSAKSVESGKHFHQARKMLLLR